MEKSCLVIFTDSYPYQRIKEDSFLEPELEILREEFPGVVLVPAYATGEPRALSVGVTADTGLWRADYSGAKLGVVGKTISGAFRAEFWDELRRSRIIWRYPLAVARLAVYVRRSIGVRRWTLGLLPQMPPDCAILLYAYWMTAAATGIAMLRGVDARVRTVSRVHGGDLYLERHQPPYLPMREQTIAGLDGVLTVSAQGRRYLLDRHPLMAAKVHTSRLGIKDPGFRNQASEDGVFRVVSCSFVQPVKRVPRIRELMFAIGRRMPERKLEWTHLGGGTGLTDLVGDGAAGPPNVTCRFPGVLPSDEVMSYYRRNPVDCFVNWSESEGLPVSIMEAMACGIPILAPAVGGIPEAVDESNGWLIGKDSEVESVAATVATCDWVAKRSVSRAKWESMFDSRRNSRALVEILRGIARAPRVAG